MRLRAKRTALKALRHLRLVETLTILPFSIEPRMAGIADGWIYDPQLWDLQPGIPADEQADPNLLAALRAAAAGRRICIAVGRQDRAKGFDCFARTWCNNPALHEQWLFAFGGQVEVSLAPMAADFAAQGGFALDRFISDAELFALYAAADMVWCAYAEDYDQASGILGRAMQFGLPVTVRAGSLIERLCQSEGHPAIGLCGQPGETLPAALPARLDASVAAPRAAAQRATSLARLRSALGLASSEP